MPKKKTTTTPAEDSARFIAAVRELECDESPKAFEATVKALATVKPKSNADVKKRAKKKPKA